MIKLEPSEIIFGIDDDFVKIIDKIDTICKSKHLIHHIIRLDTSKLNSFRLYH